MCREAWTGLRKRDTKPQSFFEPVRDLVLDDVNAETAKSGLADQLDEKVHVGLEERIDMHAHPSP